MAALLLELAKFAAAVAAVGGVGRWAVLPLLALFGLLRLAMSGLTGAVIVYAVLSWVPSRFADADDVIDAPGANRWCGRCARSFRWSAASTCRRWPLLVLLQVVAIVARQPDASGLYADG